ncbi:MAG TPA: SH3-like domain-containing protein [Paracoccaceae bacterium]|nr:SH3-like domain-containing protein [Paracoccaceae bacterium]
MSETRVRVKMLGTHGLHVRTPAYLRGRTGIVERELGAFPNPELLAYRRPGAPVRLVRVRFTMAELWGAAAENPADMLDAEIFAHWLEPAEPAHAA